MVEVERKEGKKGQFADADSNRFPVSATSAISCSPSGHPHPRVVLVFLNLCAQGPVQLVLNYQEKPQGKWRVNGMKFRKFPYT
ncbi:unnamed protein product [Prunus armeniaca]|uniref:Uncharacterized protein n=1 Tax=Prunus armeniaca TaxID=36596 RepID=A0A6J5XS69_PRUAR|nr:unnamed protein product [Prunus armeniaca]